MPTASPDDVRPVTSEKIEVPETSPPGQWIMPKPVFRQSSGRLPQGFEKQFGQLNGLDGGQSTAGTAAAVALAVEPPPTQLADVAPQPDVAEEVIYAGPEPAPPEKTRSRAMRITLIVLGVLAIVSFVAIFLAVVYFLFLSNPNESQVLN